MKKLILFLTLAVLLVYVSRAGDLTTNKNVTYRDYEILTVTDLIVTISYEAGAAEVPLEELPEDLRKSLESKVQDYKKNSPKIEKVIVHKKKNLIATIKSSPDIKSSTVDPINQEEYEELQKSIKEKETELQKLKDKLKAVDSEIFQKGTFKSTVNEARVEELKESKKDLNSDIKELQRGVKTLKSKLARLSKNK